MPPQAADPGARRSRGLGVAAAAFGLATALAAGFALALLTWPEAAAPFAAAPMSDAWAARAVYAAEAPVDLPALDAATRGGLEAAPLDAAAWLRRAAYTRTRAGGRFTGEAATALRRSWRLAPLDPDIAPARLELAFELWPDLAAGDRAAATAELEAMWRGARLRAELRRLPERIGSPTGRMASTLLVGALETSR